MERKRRGKKREQTNQKEKVIECFQFSLGNTYCRISRGMRRTTFKDGMRVERSKWIPDYETEIEDTIYKTTELKESRK